MIARHVKRCSTLTQPNARIRPTSADDTDEYIDQQADAHLDGMDPVERDQLLNAKAVALRAQYPQATLWKADTLAAIARASTRQELGARLPLMDFKSFVAQDQLSAGEFLADEERSASVSNQL